jgi:predicted nucleic acid-binding protein
LAVAISQGATTMLTNDRDFPDVDGVKILRLKDIAV